MAKCDEGYRCDVCNDDVTSIVDSDLYLRYILGEIEAEVLHVAPERHLRCNPILAQYIVDPRFEPVEVVGPFNKYGFDADFVKEKERQVTAAYCRLWQISQSEQPVSLLDYPHRPADSTGP